MNSNSPSPALLVLVVKVQLIIVADDVSERDTVDPGAETKVQWMALNVPLDTMA
jgi:hypothetical protein